MKLETAFKILKKHGWCDIPSQFEAEKTRAILYSTNNIDSNGEYITKEERQALKTIEKGDAIHRGYINGITVRSKFKYIIYGEVRGLVGEHNSINAAKRTLKKDQNGCKKQGGYSDSYIYFWNDNEWDSIP